ncbi:MAG: ABC transporter ATP-binding protein, partial [Atopobiaceae bacterium]|nr:ABC transporter ATP-binding protein [Atopobiaceae bacterium]
FREKCEKRINELVSSKNVTVLFVSHSVDQVKRVCERCIWIEKGELRMDGPSDEVADAYANHKK